MKKRQFCFKQTSSAAKVKQVTSLVKAVKLKTGAFMFKFPDRIAQTLKRVLRKKYKKKTIVKYLFEI